MTTPTTGQAPATPPADPASQAPTEPNPARTPANASRPDDPPWQRSGEPFDAARAWTLIENLRADLATARAGHAAPTAQPATSTTPAQEPPPAPADTGTVAAQVAELRAQLARERAARRHGLDDDLLDLLGTGTDEQIETRAKTLADRLQPVAGRSAGSPVPRRPVEALRGGADPTTPSEETDPTKLADLIRARSLF